MKLALSLFAAILALLALTLLLRDWAFGFSQSNPAIRASSGAVASVVLSNVKTEITSLAPPQIIDTNQPVSFVVSENIRNDGPAKDQVVLVKTLKVPMDCEGQIDSSLTVVGPDTAVVFGTMPVFAVGQDVSDSETITISCSAGGPYSFELRKEVQPLFNEDPNPADNVVIVPFNPCAPGAPDEDRDGDGLTNQMEAALGTNPCSNDTDGDGMPDGYEAAAVCLDPVVADANADPDLDGITNLVEFGLGTDPCRADTDEDGMPDGYEAAAVCLDPVVADANADPDLDGITNLVEFGLGTDPCRADTDEDGMPDGYEAAAVCLDPVVADANADPDLDGITNLVEFGLGTDPCLVDTDGDGCADGEELASHPSFGGGRDPLNRWDFYDVPVPAIYTVCSSPGVCNPVPTKDRGIGITTDVVALLKYAGAKDTGSDPRYNVDLDANTVLDGVEYDRRNASPWSGPPDGGIGITTDVAAILKQVGHSCVAPP
jgi:hypothetical protein